jgi:hypothetical protein
VDPTVGCYVPGSDKMAWYYLNDTTWSTCYSEGFTAHLKCRPSKGEDHTHLCMSMAFQKLAVTALTTAQQQQQQQQQINNNNTTTTTTTTTIHTHINNNNK